MLGKWKFVSLVLCLLAFLAATRHLWWDRVKSLPEASWRASPDTDQRPSPEVRQPTILRADSTHPPAFRSQRTDPAIPLPRETPPHEFGNADNDHLTPSAPDVTSFLPRNPIDTAASVPPGELPLPAEFPSNAATPLAAAPLAEAPPSRDLSPAGPAAPKRIVLAARSSFWTLSEEHYGSAAYYKALFAHNRDRVGAPDELDAGLELEIPALDELRSRYPQFCPATSNALRSGVKR